MAEEAVAVYTLKLLRGEDAAVFLEDWSPGGVEIDARWIGCYYTARGSGSLSSLTHAAQMWELEAVDLDLTQMLAVAFLPVWRWQEIAFAGDYTDQMRTQPEYQELVDFWRLPEPVGDEEKAKALRAVYRLSRRIGPVQRISGLAERTGAQNPSVAVFSSGLVQYPQTPHPMRFLKAMAEILGKSPRPG